MLIYPAPSRSGPFLPGYSMARSSSSPGYSGSPVVVYLPKMASLEGDIRGDTHFHMGVFVDASWLLGLVWGHAQWTEKVLEKDKRTPITEGWTVNTNSGIAQVVPVRSTEYKILAYRIGNHLVTGLPHHKPSHPRGTPIRT